MRRNTKKGFTLAELLIVIAIIAVLVAIMIPVFGAQLNKATAAAELANVRAAYAEELSDSMLGGTDLTAVVTAANVKGSVLVAAKDKTETTITLTKAPVATTYDTNGNKTAAGTDGEITVNYKGITGKFEIDEDVKIVKADGSAYAEGDEITG